LVAEAPESVQWSGRTKCRVRRFHNFLQRPPGACLTTLFLNPPLSAGASDAGIGVRRRRLLHPSHGKLNFGHRRGQIMWRAPHDRGDRDRFLVSTTPPHPQQMRAAATVVLLLLFVLAVTTPFATIPIGNSEAFLPAYATAILINDLITSVLLFAMFSIQRSGAFLLLAIGYLFAALTAVPCAL